MANVINRRRFFTTTAKATMAAALASFANVPLFVQRALAEGNIGLNGKKVLFIFLRGGNDGINTLVPIMDPAYSVIRPTIGIPKDPAVFYDVASPNADVVAANYPYGIKLGNGFAALHPALYNLSSVFNDRNLALIHRVAYPRQSRSHFDSQNYWETGSPNNNSLKEGIFYRTMIESGLAGSRALTAVSVQSNMPLIIRGKFPMTNLSSVSRYNLLGVYSTDRSKHTNAINVAMNTRHPDKDNRELIYGLGNQFKETLDIFTDPLFSKNDYMDPNNPGALLFPAGEQFYSRLKTAAQILAQTDAIVTGTQLDGFDTHTGQGSAAGSQANLLKKVGWAIYALQQYFKQYGKGGPQALPGAQAAWEDIVVVTLSEFGRTSEENGSTGTDHAEANAMFVAGGNVNGGVYLCDSNPNAKLAGPNWTPSDPVLKDGSLFTATGRYLKRAVDYRSVLGKVIRAHLGATQPQLNRIIPGYAAPTEYLKDGTPGSAVTSTRIIGEPDILPEA